MIQGCPIDFRMPSLLNRQPSLRTFHRALLDSHDWFYILAYSAGKRKEANDVVESVSSK